MGILNDEVKALINKKETHKVIGTVSRDGIVHTAYRGSLHVEGEQLVFYDLLQSSRTNKNLVNAIWFHLPVSISILGEDGSCYHITAQPERSVTAGFVFEEVYKKLLSSGRYHDLNAIWYLDPVSIQAADYVSSYERERENFPILTHLDQIVKKEMLAD